MENPLDQKNTARQSAGRIRRPPLLLAIVATLAVAAALVSAYIAFTMRPKSSTESATEPATQSRYTQTPRPKTMTLAQVQSWIQNRLKSSGATVGLVNIWATWCEPCRAEMPELVSFAKTEAAVPLFLVSADNESDIENVQTFLADNGSMHESALIKGSQDEFISGWFKMAEKSGHPWSMTLPATFVVDADGEIRDMIAGATTNAELRRLTRKHRPHGSEAARR